MSSNQTRCYRCVDDIRKMIKYGKTKSGNQRYICRKCGKTPALQRVLVRRCANVSDFAPAIIIHKEQKTE